MAPVTPLVVRIIQQPTRETTVVDVLLGALGLTGTIMLAALVFGLLLGGVLVGIRILRPDSGSRSAGEDLRFNLSSPAGS